MLTIIIMDNTSEYTVLQHYLNNNNYIILLSGLHESPINTVAKELCLALNGVVLDFMHLEASDLQPLNERIATLVANKGQLIIVKGQSYNKDLIKFYADTHINISIRIEDVEKSKQYKDRLSTNYVNKYFNFKTDIDGYIDNIFDYIIDNIEKKVYKKDYERLCHKNFTGETQARLISDPTTKNIKEQKVDALQDAVKDIEEDMDYDIDDDVEDSDENMLQESIQIA